MSVDPSLFADFLGTWNLLPESCQYEQGEPPLAGSYRIQEVDGSLTFAIDWQDAGGQKHHVEFDGIPDGKPRPFDGGELADAMSVHAVSPTELRSSAFRAGKELMVAQRQLDGTKMAMRVVQLVRIPNGPELVNTSVYQKEFIH